MAATSLVLGLCLSSAVLLLLAPETVSALPPVIRVGKSIYPNNKFSALYFSFTRDPERFEFLYRALNFSWQWKGHLRVKFSTVLVSH